MKIKILTAFLILPFTTFAANHMTYLGGGGEPKTIPKTMFDLSLVELNQFFERTQATWNYSLSFNGGHAETESIINENFKKAESKTDFGKESLKDTVADYIKKIKAGHNCCYYFIMLNRI